MNSNSITESNSELVIGLNNRFVIFNYDLTVRRAGLVCFILYFTKFKILIRPHILNIHKIEYKIIIGTF